MPRTMVKGAMKIALLAKCHPHISSQSDVSAPECGCDTLFSLCLYKRSLLSNSDMHILCHKTHNRGYICVPRANLCSISPLAPRAC